MASGISVALRALQSIVRPAGTRRPDEAIGSLLGASGAYYMSTVLLLLASVVSMPIMTRLLSKEEYGLLNLIFTIVMLLAVAGGLGLGEAAVRLYGEHRAEGKNALRRLCGSLFGGALALGVLTGLALMSFAVAIPGVSSGYRRCLLIAGVVIAVRIVSSVLSQIYQAQERAVALAATQVFVRYGTTALAIALLLVYRRDAFTVLFATVVIEAAAVAIRFYDLRLRGILTRPRLSPGTLAAAARYGAPLAIAGAARYLLDYGDRFVIERNLGLSAVATYSVAYDIAYQIAQILLTPLQLAAVPVLFRLWAEHGREETSRVASRVLGYMVVLAVPLSLLYWALNDQVILLVASSRYEESSAVTPYLLPGVILGGLNFITAVGLTIEKRTALLALNVGLAALLNLGMNLVLVPRYGLEGAALSTTVGFAALAFANYALSRSVLPLRLDGALAARTLLASALMLVLVSHAGSAAWPAWLNVATRGGVGVIVIVLCAAFLDPDLRGFAWALAAGEIGRKAPKRAVE